MSKNHGFTLVELSIVLVILGLLIGGVLTGQSLIRAAELRSVTTQYQRYQAATMTFRDKYFALPGDMPNAQSYWGVQNADPTTCENTASTDTKTCNGNGNGLIAYVSGSIELFRFWQHLANAGLIEGRYDGIQHGPDTVSTSPANAPVGRISGSQWFVQDFATKTSAWTMFDGAYGNTFEFGVVGADNDDPINPVMKPEDAYNIDSKLDDGRPGTGKLLVRSANGLANCTTTGTTTALTATYLLSSPTITCALLFRQQF